MNNTLKNINLEIAIQIFVKFDQLLENTCLCIM